MARQDFICITSIPNQSSLASSYFTPGNGNPPSEVRNDKVLAYSIQPVTEQPTNSLSLYLPDYEVTDTFSVAIGVANEPPTGGTFDLEVGSTTTGLTGLAYNIAAASLQTLLNAALTTEGEPLCTVTLLETGIYQIDAVSNGAITTGFFEVTNAALLRPECNAFFAEGFLGSATSRYQVMLVMRQSPVCYSEPTVELASADVDTDQILAGGVSGSNEIIYVFFTIENVYAGSFRLAATINGTTETCGVGYPGMDTVQMGALLANHSLIKFMEPDGTVDNIRVTIGVNGWYVEFVDDLADTAGISITATNIDLIGPTGKSGTINLNTFGLYKYSLDQDSDEWEMTLSIQRQRATGEVATIYLDTIVIKADIIDTSTLVPTPLPSYYTAAQVDALLAANVTAANGRFVRYDASQSLSGGEQTQALTNAGGTAPTGSGALVRATSATLVTPTLGVATATSVNKVAITAPATSSTLTIANSQTLTVTNSVTFTASGAPTIAFGDGTFINLLLSTTPVANAVYTVDSAAASGEVISFETTNGLIVAVTVAP